MSRTHAPRLGPAIGTALAALLLITLPAPVAAAAVGGLPTTVHQSSAARSAAVPLDRAFDDIAVAAGSGPVGAGLDGAGNAFPETELARAGWSGGSMVTVDGTAFRLPSTAPGRPDNAVADGQVIAVSGSGDAIGFLATSTDGPVTGHGEIGYQDGSTSTFTLTVPDWRGATALRNAAVTVPHVTGSGGSRSGAAGLYALTVPITHGKPVASVTLPGRPAGAGSGSPAVHVFAVAVRDTATAPAGQFWAGSWGTSLAWAPPVPQTPDWSDQTLRLVIHPHTSGSLVRLHFANTFAADPVEFGRVSIAVQSLGGAATSTPVPLTFGGSESTTLPAGGETYSDPLDFTVKAGQNILVSIFLPKEVTWAPVHPYTLTTSYSTARSAGDRTADTGSASFGQTFGSWAFLSGLDVSKVTDVGTVVALGDSQTDGGHSTSGANRRWPDDYATDLGDQPSAPGVVNAGISGNRLLRDSTDESGPSGLSRLDRDVFAEPDVHTLVLYEGINDISLDDATATAVENGILAVAGQAHDRGVRLVVATIPPFGGNSAYTEARENVREAVNAFIRASPQVDQAVDFDVATRDPDLPSRLRDGLFDPADHLHFNDSGTQLLADTLASGRPVTATRMSQTTAGDFDGDGHTDLVARDDATGDLKMWTARGDGTFAPARTVTSGWRPYSQTVAADFTGDGRADLMGRDASGELKLWVGRGDGTFVAPVQVTTGWSVTQTVAADFTGDGRADLMGRDASGELKLWVGRGDGTFVAPVQVTTGWQFTQTVAGFFDAGASADLIARDDSTGELLILAGRGNGTFGSPVELTEGW